MGNDYFADPLFLLIVLILIIVIASALCMCSSKQYRGRGETIGGFVGAAALGGAVLGGAVTIGGSPESDAYNRVINSNTNGFIIASNGKFLTADVARGNLSWGAVLIHGVQNGLTTTFHTTKENPDINWRIYVENVNGKKHWLTANSTEPPTELKLVEGPIPNKTRVAFVRNKNEILVEYMYNHKRVQYDLNFNNGVAGVPAFIGDAYDNTRLQSSLCIVSANPDDIRQLCRFTYDNYIAQQGTLYSTATSVFAIDYNKMNVMCINGDRIEVKDILDADFDPNMQNNATLTQYTVNSGIYYPQYPMDVFTNTFTGLQLNQYSQAYNSDYIFTHIIGKDPGGGKPHKFINHDSMKLVDMNDGFTPLFRVTNNAGFGYTFPNISTIDVNANGTNVRTDQTGLHAYDTDNITFSKHIYHQLTDKLYTASNNAYNNRNPVTGTEYHGVNKVNEMWRLCVSKVTKMINGDLKTIKNKLFELKTAQNVKGGFSAHGPEVLGLYNEADALTQKLSDLRGDVHDLKDLCAFYAMYKPLRQKLTRPDGNTPGPTAKLYSYSVTDGNGNTQTGSRPFTDPKGRGVRDKSVASAPGVRPVYIPCPTISHIIENNTFGNYGTDPEKHEALYKLAKIHRNLWKALVTPFGTNNIIPKDEFAKPEYQTPIVEFQKRYNSLEPMHDSFLKIIGDRTSELAILIKNEPWPTGIGFYDEKTDLDILKSEGATTTDMLKSDANKYIKTNEFPWSEDNIIPGDSNSVFKIITQQAVAQSEVSDGPTGAGISPVKIWSDVDKLTELLRRIYAEKRADGKPESISHADLHRYAIEWVSGNTVDQLQPTVMDAMFRQLNHSEKILDMNMHLGASMVAFMDTDRFDNYIGIQHSANQTMTKTYGKLRSAIGNDKANRITINNMGLSSTNIPNSSIGAIIIVVPNVGERITGGALYNADNIDGEFITPALRKASQVASANAGIIVIVDNNIKDKVMSCAAYYKLKLNTEKTNVISKTPGLSGLNGRTYAALFYNR